MERGTGDGVIGALATGVDEIRAPTGTVTDGVVDVGKHLRPSFRGGRVVLFVGGGAASARQADPAARWKALKLP